MALKRYENESDIPEYLKADYVKKGNAWVPDYDDSESVSALTRSLEQAKKEAKETKERFRDVDLEQYKKWQEENEKQRRKELIDAGKHDQLLSEAIEKTRTEYKALLKERDDINEKLSKRLEKTLITDRVTRALMKNNAEPATMDIAAQHISGLFELSSENEEPVLSADSGFSSVTDKGEPHTIESFAASYLSERPNLIVRGKGATDDTLHRSKGNMNGTGVKVIQTNDRNKAFFENMDDIGKGKAVIGS